MDFDSGTSSELLHNSDHVDCNTFRNITVPVYVTGATIFDWICTSPRSDFWTWLEHGPLWCGRFSKNRWIIIEPFNFNKVFYYILFVIACYPHATLVKYFAPFCPLPKSISTCSELYSVNKFSAILYIKISIAYHQLPQSTVSKALRSCDHKLTRIMSTFRG